ncbi:MAG: type II toxin-antitoxin system RelE/ParE family toxin [Sphingomonadales bacterium]|nr:type II toxin-antitoxin system RelE/ParE family toxin [Sphingomonadales bacterium]
MTYIPRNADPPDHHCRDPELCAGGARIWSEEELAALINHLAHNPEDGDVIPGAGGVRKLRWGKAGVGKRGGAGVIYFYYRQDCPLYLLLAYAKAQASDLSADEKKAVAGFAAIIKGAADT